MIQLFRYTIKKITVLSCIFFFCSGFLWGQKDTTNAIHLLRGADNITMSGIEGIYFISGHVKFRKNETSIYCDSAYYNTIEKYIMAYGRIHLNKHDTLNMFCDSLHLNLVNDHAKMYSNVRVRDNTYKLTTDSMVYNLDKNVGIYRNNGIITSISTNDRLTSVIGKFYPDIDQFHFSHKVIYTSDRYIIHTDTLQFNGRKREVYFFGPTTIHGDSIDMYAEKGWYSIKNDKGVLRQNAFVKKENINVHADSLYYAAIDSLYEARNNVHIIDTAYDMELFGKFAIHNEKTQRGFITGRALAKHNQGDSSLYIHADTLFSYTDTAQKIERIKGYYGVQIFRNNMQGVCDSIVYNKSTHNLVMYNHPLLWARDAQLSGDTITVFESHNQIDSAHMRKNGLIISHVKRTNYYNQIAGTTMNAYFDSSQIKRIDIAEKAKTIYFLEQKEENDTAIIITRKGMNRLYASDITIRLDSGQIETITYRNKPSGVLYPMTQINKKEERVKQFKWKPERRPISWRSMILTNQEMHSILTIWEECITFRYGAILPKGLFSYLSSRVK